MFFAIQISLSASSKDDLNILTYLLTYLQFGNAPLSIEEYIFQVRLSLFHDLLYVKYEY
jgi:hypothetical protein